MIKKQIRYIDMKTLYAIFKVEKIDYINELIIDLKNTICKMPTINYFILQKIKKEYIEEKILENDLAKQELFKIIINYLIKDIKFNEKRINLSVVEILINDFFLGEKVKI
jgi:hypothetical protein